MDSCGGFDGARTGVGVNLPLIEQMTKLGLKIELGGGIRSEEDFVRRMECGVARCVLGTAAIENPALMAWAAKTYPAAWLWGLTPRTAVWR